MEYDLKNKVIIITGANSGIGKAAAIQLAKLGAVVVMACRSRERGLQALDEVRGAADNDDTDLMQVDMSSQKSIRRFVAEFYNCYDEFASPYTPSECPKPGDYGREQGSHFLSTS
jgi:NAD(P)-dependent dehydrogenase (short-subunit alcohol dehydrogenase family)